MNLEIGFEHKNSKKSFIFITFELQEKKQPCEDEIVLKRGLNISKTHQHCIVWGLSDVFMAGYDCLGSCQVFSVGA